MRRARRLHLAGRMPRPHVPERAGSAMPPGIWRRRARSPAGSSATVALRGDAQSRARNSTWARDGAGELRNRQRDSFRWTRRCSRSFRATSAAPSSPRSSASSSRAGGSPRAARWQRSSCATSARWVRVRWRWAPTELTFDGAVAARWRDHRPAARPRRTVRGGRHGYASARRVRISCRVTSPDASADAERLVREITLGAPPDASGRSAFSFEGSY